MKYLIFLMFSFNSFAFSLISNNDARFNNEVISIKVTENSVCSNTGHSKEEILSFAKEAVKKFWNRVPSSNLSLSTKGFLNSSDQRFTSGVFCVEDSSKTCDANQSIPDVSGIIISCNTNSIDNFLSNEFALSAPRTISGQNITGAILLINDTVDSPIKKLSKEEFINVIAHEIGHAIGIGHSEKEEALMYYEYFENRNRLSLDDIDAVTYLYPNQLDGCHGIIGKIDEKNDPWKGFIASLFFGLLLIIILSITKRRLSIAW